MINKFLLTLNLIVLFLLVSCKSFESQPSDIVYSDQDHLNYIKVCDIVAENGQVYDIMCVFNCSKDTPLQVLNVNNVQNHCNQFDRAVYYKLFLENTTEIDSDLRKKFNKIYDEDTLVLIDNNNENVNSNLLSIIDKTFKKQNEDPDLRATLNQPIVKERCMVTICNHFIYRSHFNEWKSTVVDNKSYYQHIESIYIWSYFLDKAVTYEEAQKLCTDNKALNKKWRIPTVEEISETSGESTNYSILRQLSYDYLNLMLKFESKPIPIWIRHDSKEKIYEYKFDDNVNNKNLIKDPANQNDTAYVFCVSE